MSRHVLAFVLVVIPVLLVPGPDVLLILRNTATGGRRLGGATAAGVCTGVTVHAGAAAVGLSALLATSAEAFTVLKMVGAAYLVYLGVQSLRSARRCLRSAADQGHEDASEASDGGLSPRRAFGQGLLTNTLNPKVAIFFLAFLPQFITPGSSTTGQTLLLGAIFIAMSVVWLTGVVTAAAAGRRALQRPRVRSRLDAVAGVVFLGFAGRLAFTRA